MSFDTANMGFRSKKKMVRLDSIDGGTIRRPFFISTQRFAAEHRATLWQNNFLRIPHPIDASRYNGHTAAEGCGRKLQLRLLGLCGKPNSTV